MNVFRNLFGRSQNNPNPAPALSQVDSGSGEFVYFVNYREVYETIGTILGVSLSQKVLAELFLFRGWTTQFGYRIFSSNHAASEELINETVSLISNVGLKIFQDIHGFSIEDCLGGDYIRLVDSRWQEYDRTFIANKDHSDFFAAPQIIWRLNQFLEINDPVASLTLEGIFTVHLMKLKERAKQLNLF